MYLSMRRIKAGYCDGFVLVLILFVLIMDGMEPGDSCDVRDMTCEDLKRYMVGVKLMTESDVEEIKSESVVQ